MRVLKLIAPFIVLAGAGTLLFGGPASGQTTASIVAKDFEFRAVPDGPPALTIAAGGSVGFSQAAGMFPHNVRFTGAQPASCLQSVGTSSGSVPPLPSPASSAAWAGTCTFAAAGEYPFVCEVHGNMTGKITVTGSTLPPPPPPPPPPISPPPPVSPPPPPPPGTTPGSAASLLRITTPQRSFTLRGSVDVTRSGSRLLARAFARRGALSGGRSTLLVQVGRQLRSSVGPGRVSFSLPLTAAGRRALRRNGRLAITLRLTVDPTTGTTYAAKRTVILRAP